MPHQGIWKDYDGDERFWITRSRAHLAPIATRRQMSNRSSSRYRRGPPQDRVFGRRDPLVFLHGADSSPRITRFSALGPRRRVFALLRVTAIPRVRRACATYDITLHSFDVRTRRARSADPVGHSMGGMIAAEMAAVAPREVERLALIAPAGLWLDAHPIPDLFSKLPHELPALLFHDPAFGERMMTAGGNLDDPKFLEAFIIRNTRQLAMAGKLLFPIPDRGLGERLYRIRAKTVLIWGDSDRTIPPAHGDEFCRCIADGGLVRIPSAGHMVIVEQPDAVVDALVRLE
jgi:pimeloyl-ACP methyl ester carboxylesterase